jgi:hypothetical protein
MFNFSTLSISNPFLEKEEKHFLLVEIETSPTIISDNR